MLSKRQDPIYQAQEILSRRDHSEREVRIKLAKKGFSADQVDEAITWLYQRKLLDDAKFAQLYVTNTLRFKAVGPRWLINQLQQKGIAVEQIEPAIFEALDDAAELKLAHQAARQWQKTHQKYQHDRTRLARHLYSRGFSPECVDTTLGAALHSA
ncbi:regulatory protein RecX [Patescibacteria group bacterium]|nr:regulatory protein RecX [Patescibacteria group bacterium]